MAEPRARRPRLTAPLAPDTVVTAPGVSPAITVAQLDALSDRLGCRLQRDFAEALGVTQGYISLILSGRKQIVDGTLHVVIVEKLWQHRLL